MHFIQTFRSYVFLSTNNNNKNTVHYSNSPFVFRGINEIRFETTWAWIDNDRIQIFGMYLWISYPERTPKTRLSTKNEPIMMRGMKYTQFHVGPKASLVCGKITIINKLSKTWVENNHLKIMARCMLFFQ